MSCNVCVEPFNRSTRLSVKCPSCGFESCRSCCETFLTTNENASCMNCKKDWDYKTLTTLFTRVFVDKVYKKHIEKTLFDKERALLPATQVIVEEERRKDAIRARISEINNEISSLKKKVKGYCEQLNSSSEDPKQVFVKKCPVDSCRGFLSSQWKCGLCDTWCCPDCHEIRGSSKTSPHTCKQENIETARLLEKDTKPCPSCACPIFKILGCDQMFCTQCQTAFSWKTGRVETGVIHNPHYFEWQQRRGNGERNLLEIRCGREIDHHFINMISGVCGDKMLEIARSLIHIRIVELPKYATNRIQDNQDLRILYLKSEITEEKFKQLLQKRQKQFNKNREIAHIVHMHLNCSTEILYRFVEEIMEQGTIPETQEQKYLLEWKELAIYTNECLKNVSILYKNQLNIVGILLEALLKDF